MLKHIMILCLLFTIVSVLCQTNSTEQIVKRLKSVYRLKSNRDVKSFYEALKMNIEHWNRSRTLNPHKFKAISPGFPCQPYGPSPQKPTSVHQLRPGGMLPTLSD
jgi:hypothetical protein